MGQTKDTSAPLDRFRIMRITYNSERSMVVLNYPGWIGNFALTSDFVCFTGNTLYGFPSDRQTNPGSLLKRIIMEGSSVQAILEKVKGMTFGTGCISMADRSGRAVSMETVSGRVAIRDVSGEAYGHANTVLIRELKPYENASQRCASSEYRQKNLGRSLASQTQPITIDYLKRLTSDHADFPLSICRHPSPKDRDTTNAAFIADITAQEMNIAIGNPCVAAFKKYPVKAT
jgi:isopenicillin-N N-acyltransferase-like protein